jgi:hypothetical protein
MDVIFVLGVHRSGTSVATKALESLEVQIGENFRCPGRNNPKGFFEDLAFRQVNSRVLSAARGAWNTPPTDKQLEDVANGPLGAIALKTLEAKLGGAPIGLKDPRMCLLLPFWMRTLSLTGLKVGCVVTVRNPAGVVASLQQRNISSKKGADLWLLYMISVMTNLIDSWRTVVIEYEAVLCRPRTELQRMAAVLGLSVNEINAAEFSNRFLEQSLWRNRKPVDSSHAALRAKRVYADLQHMTSLRRSLFSTDREPFKDHLFHFLGQR